MARGGIIILSLPLMTGSCPTSVIRLLLEAKADPNPAQRGSGHFHSPLGRHPHSPESVRLLLEAGADPHKCPDNASFPVFLSFVGEGAPAASLRLLLDYNADIVGQEQGKGRTPISVFVNCGKHCPQLQDVLLQIPYPIPAACCACVTPGEGCWELATGDWLQYRSPEFLRALVKMGYPTRGRLRAALKRLCDNKPPEDVKYNVGERLQILQSVTAKGQRQRRQEYLGGFWVALMQTAPLSGVMASLVLQAIVPEFKLRIA